MDRPDGDSSSTPMQAKRIRITQGRGTVSRPRNQRRILAGLGLGRPGKSVVREDTPSIRGMVFKIQHLIKVEAVEGAEQS